MGLKFIKLLLGKNKGLSDFCRHKVIVLDMIPKPTSGHFEILRCFGRAKKCLHICSFIKMIVLIVALLMLLRTLGA